MIHVMPFLVLICLLEARPRSVEDLFLGLSQLRGVRELRIDDY
jgi:hypothetical protein